MALARMQEFRQTRVFWYQPTWRLSSWVSWPHYSALAQTYYGVELARLARSSGDAQIAEAADQVMRSLLVPVADGGVLATVCGHPAFEEAPVQPVSLILNGWLSVLASTAQYAELKGVAEWRDVVAASLDASNGYCRGMTSTLWR
ncbi:D-glucuronyl C5-epimerase family protein [Jiangella muralis]|uniref:D-glucuronyl C5-epimerase family protein n=1 Tax=Jiangella muralis TaxID=702383 RepID=UPI0014701922|nr:D-glucuronyl C5-epimerase family protein [Jiangella muralis]